MKINVYTLLLCVGAFCFGLNVTDLFLHKPTVTDFSSQATSAQMDKAMEAEQKAGDIQDAFKQAIQDEDDETVKLMLAHHVDVNAGRYDYSPIDWALAVHRMDYLQWFAKAGGKGLEWVGQVPEGNKEMAEKAMRSDREKREAAKTEQRNQARRTYLSKQLWGSP